MTLVEMVLGITIAGIVMASIGMSLIVIMRTDKPTSERLTESRDVAFLQTYLPVDYSSAITRDVTPGLQPIVGQTLDGTNVLTLFREEKDGNTIVESTISYRYAKTGNDWQLIRYEYGNPTSPTELKRTIVVHQLAAPPAGWTAGTKPDHAIVVNARNATSAQPVADDMTVTFASGNAFATGGAALANDSNLPSDYTGGTSDPAAVKSRCGGRVTLILDVSGSIASVPTGPADVKSAATGFIDAFTGTPSEVHVMKFSNNASVVYPAAFGEYFSVLNSTDPDIAAAKAQINAMVINGGTNWEDPLYRATRDGAGVNHEFLPELVVFVTDGDPTAARSYPWNWNWMNTSERYAYATSVAVTAANYARERDARVIGILVGSATGRPDSVNRLKQVVGSVAWTGTSATDIGNAATADYFLPPGGDFSKLGGVLKAVAAGECGGTVTVQKKIDQGGTLLESDDPWSFTSDVGVKELYPSDLAVTFDYSFPPGVSTLEATINEQPNAGYQLDRIECTSNGSPLGKDRVSKLPQSQPGVKVKVKPNEAVSCTFISVAS